MWRERKARTGVDHTFWWRASEPLQLASTPTLAVRSQTPVLAAVLSDQTVASIASDRRTLTLLAPVSVLNTGPQGHRGAAFLHTFGDGIFPVHVTRVNGTACLLADTLPHGVTIATDATLQWAWFSATLSGADVTATAARNLPWRVDYTADYGDDIADDVNRRDEGLLHVTRQPFRTGLDNAGLLDTIASLSQMVHRRQQDHSGAIAVAERELIMQLRADAPSGIEDRVMGSALYDAHAYLAAAAVVEGAQAEQAERFRVRGWALYDLAMRSEPWIDFDDDGVVDAGETALQVSGPRSPAGGASRVGDPPWTFGMDH